VNPADANGIAALHDARGARPSHFSTTHQAKVALP
jgi:hypothetical protein